MSVFAITYTYVNDDEGLAKTRPEHREFLNALATEGFILASGPTTDGAAPHALLLVQSPSLDDALRTLDRDPFALAGLISHRDIRPWNPVIGAWSALATQ